MGHAWFGNEVIPAPKIWSLPEGALLADVPAPDALLEGNAPTRVLPLNCADTILAAKILASTSRRIITTLHLFVNTLGCTLDSPFGKFHASPFGANIKVMLGRIPILAVLCALPLAALTQDRELTQYVHRIWQTQQGLPDGAITRILQDKQGYIWLATETGFTRFDGVRFTPAERLWPTAPAGLNVRAAVQDDAGTFWLGGNDGNVYAVRPTVTTKYTQELGLPGGQIQCMVPDPKGGAIWTCFERGLTRIATTGKSSVQVFGPADGLWDDNMHTACVDSQGRVWAGGDGPKIGVGTNGKFKVFTLKGYPQVASIRALLCDGDTIWAGGSAGLVKLNANQPEQQTWFTAKDGLAANWVYTITPGMNGALWVGTRTGFSRLRGDRIDSFGPREGLSQSSALSMLEDHEGSLWVGTKRGLNQFSDGRIVLYSTSEGLPSSQAGPVLQDSNAVIWAGTLDAGLARFDGRRFTKVDTGSGASMVRALVEEPGKALWVGTSNGIVTLVNGHAAAHYGTAQGLPSADIRALFRDRDGVLWAGTADGIASLSGGRFVAHAGAPKGAIRCIGQDRDGNILVGVDEGIYIQGKGGFTQLRQDEIYLQNPNAFLLDKDGLLWVALNGGALRMIDGPKIHQFLSRDGLYDAELLGLGDRRPRPPVDVVQPGHLLGVARRTEETRGRRNIDAEEHELQPDRIAACD